MNLLYVTLNPREKLGGLVLDCDAIYHDLLKTDTALLRSIEFMRNIL